jgi:hypothetical protein
MPLAQQAEHRQANFIAFSEDDLTDAVGDSLGNLLYQFDVAGTTIIAASLARFRWIIRHRNG